MVVLFSFGAWLYTAWSCDYRAYNTYMYSQLSVVLPFVVLPSKAVHDALFEYSVRFAIFSTVAYRT